MIYDEAKFKEFNDMLDTLQKSEPEIVIIHHPEVLGDNYEELVENLNRLADHKLQLAIVPRKYRNIDPSKFLNWKK